MKTNHKLDLLKIHLSELTFGVVANPVNASDNNLICFRSKSDMLTWDDDLDFMSERERFTQEAWERSDRNYSLYFGFASKGNQDILFTSKTQSDNENFCQLGVFTKQEKLSPPKVGSWIVGRRDLTAEAHRPRFSSWAVCTKQEKMFVDCFLGRHKITDVNRNQWLRWLYVSRKESTNHLCNMAVLLVLRDLEYFMNDRRMHGARAVDSQVAVICSEYATDLWEEYQKRAFAQRIYSSVIPEPAPQRIEDRANLDSVMHRSV